MKTDCIRLWTIYPEIYSILIFLEKVLGIVSPQHFVYDFSRKMFLYQLMKFHCLIAFISSDIWQYVYWNCLLRDRTLSMQEEGLEGFCGGHEIF